MKNYLDFEKEIKNLEQEVDELKALLDPREFLKLTLIRSKILNKKLTKNLMKYIPI